MKWEYFGATMIFVVVGYLIGSISWSIIITKFKYHDDIRTKGSGNAGATNTLRNFGIKVGLIVFILDILKPIIAALIAYEVKIHSTNFLSGILVQAAAFGAIIGHIFPIFFKFKGGKGAASFLGLFILMNWLIAIIGFFVFMIIVFKTKMVSAGSILAPFILIFFQIAFIYIPHLNDYWTNPLTRDPYLWINTIFLSITWIIVTIMHRENIKRILQGNERKLNFKKNK